MNRFAEASIEEIERALVEARGPNPCLSPTAAAASMAGLVEALEEIIRLRKMVDYLCNRKETNA